MDNLFSFAVEPTMPASIWDTLREQIAKVVRSDVKTDAGKRKLDAMVLPGSKPEYYIQRAIKELDALVAEFYYWYFIQDNDLKLLVERLPEVDQTSEAFSSAVRAVVISNLEAMAEVNELPPGKDVESLIASTTKDMIKLLINWQDWYWDYLQEEIIDEYYELKSIEEELYLDDEYGDYTNITTAYQDPPYSD